MDLEGLLDREQIRDATLRYCRGIDRLDVDLVRSAYWPDAIDQHGTFTGLGWDFAQYAVGRIGLTWAATMHLVANHTIDLDGERATGELYNISSHLRRGDDRVCDLWWGRYVDRYERRGDEWRISHRVCVHEWTTTAALPLTMPMDVAAFTQGSFDRREPPA